MIQIGAVPYTNALPLCSFFEGKIHYDFPKNLAELMKNEALDLALLPSFDYLRNPSYFIYPEAGLIQSEGVVKSVCVFVHKKIASIEKVKSIKFTSESVTSISLFKVIFNFYLGQNWENLEILSEDQKADALLYIGDQALLFNNPNYKVYDLGELWTKWTNLPFVYASWISRYKIEDELLNKLIESKNLGLAQREELIQNQNDVPAEILRPYLHENIKYEMNEKSLEGLRRFQAYCFDLGLLKEKRIIP